MLVTVAGIVTLVRLFAPWQALCGIADIPLSNDMDEILFLNALLLMLVTLFGIVIELSAVQPSYAYEPIRVAVFGICADGIVVLL